MRLSEPDCTVKAPLEPTAKVIQKKRSSTAAKLDIPSSIEPEASTSQHFISTTTCKRYKPDPLIISSPSILPELVEPVSSNVKDHIELLENIDLLSDNNIEVDTDVSNTQKSLTCIYCDQKSKRHKSKRLSLISSDHKVFLSRVKEQNENHTEFIDKIVNYSHPQIYYHKICQLNFSYKASSNKKTPKTDWHDLRQQHQAAFGEICSFIEENIIQKGRCYFLTYIFQYYMGLLEESKENNGKEIGGDFKPHTLESKIRKKFGNEIKYFMIHHTILLAPKNLEAIDEQLYEREISVPEDLLQFYSTLIVGNNQKRKNNPNCIHQVKSLCEDVVYGIYNEKIKTPKHIMLGMALKNLTSSHEIIDIIHGYGHCIIVIQKRKSSKQKQHMSQ
ncbi:Protein of unknown function [Cotesia congregata]|uniref:Uncharacterized protein n=1 Tax=Cotesia congregata TaxID=51543 RepID=A0A8J2HPS5_COTCN|nr:Protein of unknown function [Cotesia congregata]